LSIDIQTQATGGKTLYNYQLEDLNKIFSRINQCPTDYNVVYQLPTGGGKTVIFSEIARRYIAEKNKKVLILTHRIELSRQTSEMLINMGVANKVINSAVKNLEDQEEFNCFVAMVETLNNRLHEKAIQMNDIGLVIIDEAHYNSFRKLFKFFEQCFILGVTATPLSSNLKLPMHEIYKELIVGHPISFLVKNNFLAKATTFTYEVGLSTLKVGINGDYTVKSSEELYTTVLMQSKLLYAYEQHAKGKKTLIFNNGIMTSQHVYHLFKDKGYDIRHLDNHHSKKQRKEIIDWFRAKPDAILTSVSILTTGFDEPGIKTIILNRATKSPALYYQMIGRGSRAYPGKTTFDVIDLGNNAARFGLWEEELDWPHIFKAPEQYLETLISDDDIERQFKYRMPDELRAKFSNSEDIDFNIFVAYKKTQSAGQKSSKVIDQAIDQHARIVLENSDSLMDALGLARELEYAISDRVRQFGYCISNSTRNYRSWVEEDYMERLRRILKDAF